MLLQQILHARRSSGAGGRGRGSGGHGEGRVCSKQSTHRHASEWLISCALLARSSDRAALLQIQPGSAFCCPDRTTRRSVTTVMKPASEGSASRSLVTSRVGVAAPLCSALLGSLRLLCSGATAADGGQKGGGGEEEEKRGRMRRTIETKPRRQTQKKDSPTRLSTTVPAEQDLRAFGRSSSRRKHIDRIQAVGTSFTSVAASCDKRSSFEIKQIARTDQIVRDRPTHAVVNISAYQSIS